MPSTRDRVYRNENFVEINPVEIKIFFFQVSKKTFLSLFYVTF